MRITSFSRTDLQVSFFLMCCSWVVNPFLLAPLVAALQAYQRKALPITLFYLAFYLVASFTLREYGVSFALDSSDDVPKYYGRFLIIQDNGLLAWLALFVGHPNQYAPGWYLLTYPVGLLSNNIYAVAFVTYAFMLGVTAYSIKKLCAGFGVVIFLLLVLVYSEYVAQVIHLWRQGLALTLIISASVACVLHYRKFSILLSVAAVFSHFVAAPLSGLIIVYSVMSTSSARGYLKVVSLYGVFVAVLIIGAAPFLYQLVGKGFGGYGDIISIFDNANLLAKIILTACVGVAGFYFSFRSEESARHLGIFSGLLIVGAIIVFLLPEDARRLTYFILPLSVLVLTLIFGEIKNHSLRSFVVFVVVSVALIRVVFNQGARINFLQYESFFSLSPYLSLLRNVSL